MAGKLIQLRIYVQEDEWEFVKQAAIRRTVNSTKWTQRELAATWASIGLSNRVTEERARLKRQQEQLECVASK